MKPAAGVGHHSANLGDLQGRAALSLLDTTKMLLSVFKSLLPVLTTPQMHLVNSQCDNAPERALYLTGEEDRLAYMVKRV